MEPFRLAQPTRYPIEAVFERAAQQVGPRKALEVAQMHRFLDELALPEDGVLEPRETPDFVYHVARRRIGIEIRKLFDNSPIEEAARRERIVTEAQRLVAGDHRFDGVRLWVLFGNAPLPTVRRPLKNSSGRCPASYRGERLRESSKDPPVCFGPSACSRTIRTTQTPDGGRLAWSSLRKS